MIASHARTLPMAMGYTVCSSMLMVTNKLALRVFPYPSLLMAVQFLVSASVVRGLSLLSVLDVEPLILGRVRSHKKPTAVHALMHIQGARTHETCFELLLPSLMPWLAVRAVGEGLLDGSPLL